MALERLDSRPDETAYVGDAPEDIEMGKRGNVLTVGVRSNYPSSARLLSAEPDIYLETMWNSPDTSVSEFIVSTPGSRCLIMKSILFHRYRDCAKTRRSIRNRETEHKDTKTQMRDILRLF